MILSYINSEVEIVWLLPNVFSLSHDTTEEEQEILG